MSQSKSLKTCEEDTCLKAVKTRGMCSNHYEQWRRKNRHLVKPKKGRWDNADGSRMGCFKPGCDKPVETQGLCKQHYSNFHYLTTKGANKTRRNRKLTDYDGVRTVPDCTFEGCDNLEFNPGLCAGHYYQGLRGEELRPLHERHDCPVPGCDGSFNVKLGKRGVCRSHSDVMWRFSLSRERLIELMEPGVCSTPGCLRTDRLVLDHDHSCCPPVGGGTRKVSCGECVRGVLCNGCNTALGLLGEDLKRIAGLRDYIERFQGGTK